jgi:uncharacterized RDD family membrane protein YckC
LEKLSRQSEVDDILGSADLMTLVELQRFLADELAGSVESTEDFSRAFLPLTDGLGLESPAKREAPAAPRPAAPKIALDLPIDFTPVAEEQPQPEKRPGGQLDSIFEGRTAGAAESPAAAPEKAEPAPAQSHEPSAFERPSPFFADASEIPQPPPVPQASLARRTLAGMADIFFVLTLWLIATALTSTALGGSTDGLLTRLPHELLRHEVLRYALLEYALIWLLYFTACVGIAHATIGMWAWGMRVATGDAADGGWTRKFVRALASFLLVAPLFTIPLLILRIKGRNTIDLLSGTHVYRTAL